MRILNQTPAHPILRKKGCAGLLQSETGPYLSINSRWIFIHFIRKTMQSILNARHGGRKVVILLPPACPLNCPLSSTIFGIHPPG